jgi:hypothetical protein
MSFPDGLRIATEESPAPRCPSCGGTLRVDEAYCPHCGTWDRVRSAPEPANPWDNVGAILMAIAAAAVTVPTLLGLIDVVRGRNHPDAVVLAAWHCYVWGVPIGVVLYRWRRNLLTHRPATERLAKTYLVTQFLVLFLLPCVILVALLALKELFR